MKHIFLCAGEISGDLQGSYIVKELANNEDLRLFGIGGERMKKYGMEVLYDITSMNTVGLIEGLKYYFKIRQNVFKPIVKLLKENPPDLAILIDNQGLNIPLSKKLKSFGVKTVYYFPPPVSIWHREVAKKLKSSIDQFIVPFKDDHEIYAEYGCSSVFSGHPMIDTVKADKSKEEISQIYNIQDDEKIIGLLPGSRQQEVYKFLKVMLQAAQIVSSKIKCKFILPVASSDYKSYVNETIAEFPDLKITAMDEMDYNILAACDIHIMSSGTATLESALLNVPMVILYKIHPITFFIAKKMVYIDSVGLPNIIAKKKIAPELLQKEMNPDRIAQEAFKYLHDPEYYNETKQNLLAIKNELGEPNVVNRIADNILNLI